MIETTILTWTKKYINAIDLIMLTPENEPHWYGLNTLLSPQPEPQLGDPLTVRAGAAEVGAVGLVPHPSEAVRVALQQKQQLINKQIQIRNLNNIRIIVQWNIRSMKRFKI